MRWTMGWASVPERGGIGLEAMQEPGEGVVGGGIGRFGLHRGGLRTAKRLRGSDEEIDVVAVAAFGLGVVHAGYHGHPSQTAQYGHPTTTA